MNSTYILLHAAISYRTILDASIATFNALNFNNSEGKLKNMNERLL